MMFATSIRRVESQTSDEINARIRRETEESVRRHASGGAHAIERRLAALDAEWDVERTLETLAPSLTLLGLTLGVTVNRRWLAVPFVVQAFFLQHALQGWCPPLPVLRRLGVRTTAEIDEERYALKARRGDVGGVREF